MALNNEPRTTPASPARSQVKSQVRPKGVPRPVEKEYEGTPLSMTGIRSGLLYSTVMKIVLGLLIVIFAGGILISSLAPTTSSNTANGPASPGPDPIAHVGTQDVSRDKLQNGLFRQIAMMEQFGQKTGAMDFLTTKQRALQSLTDEASQYQAAQEAGITVSDADIDAKITKDIDDQIKQEQGGNEALFRRQIEAQHGSIDAYKADMRTKFDRELVARALMIEKLEKKIKDETKVTEADYKQSVTKLHLRQIVIRPKLASPTEKDQKAAQEKNANEAKTHADKIAAQLKANPTLANFATVAKKESDDTTTKTKGGDNGWKLPSELYFSPAIKDALVKASGSLVGPLHDEVTKDNYIFFIEGRRLELPKDYSKPKKKEEYIKNFETTKDNEVWAKYQEDLKKKYEVAVYDPALEAYKAQTEQIFSAPPDQQNALRQQAVEKYKEALNYAGALEKSSIRYQMAQLYRELKQPNERAAVLAEAVKDNPRDTTLGIDYARALREQNKTKEAVEQLQKVAKQLDESPAPQGGMMMMGGGNPNDQMRRQIAAEFGTLNRNDLATAERKKIKTPAQPPMSQFGGMGGMPGGAAPVNISPGGATTKTITIPAQSGKGAAKPTKQ